MKRHRRIRLAKVIGLPAAVVGSLLALGSGVVLLGGRRFDRRVRGDVDALLAAAGPGREGVVTETLLEPLPEPVRRYLRFTGVVGRPFPRVVHVEQTGTMQLGPEFPRVPLDFVTDYTLDPPGFVWYGAMHVGPLPLARALDVYHDGHGSMLVRAGSLVTVVDARGAEMDQGAMMRYLSEMIWFPAAFLGDNITFEPLDEASAQVSFTDHGHSVSGTLYVDEAGRLVEFTARQWRSVGNRFELTPWSTPVTGYAEFAGLRLPSSGKARWRLPEGDLDYIDCTVTRLTYTPSATGNRAARTAAVEALAR
ncbi:MAG TPA: DUF6544 family protein [Thermomicrobiaceae bacterium]|nr:DUF6544 family protein [Thermomicrobiaceae bacterium]